MLKWASSQSSLTGVGAITPSDGAVLAALASAAVGF